MSKVEVHACECATCMAGMLEYHNKIILFASRLDEQQCRWFAGLEAMRMGRGGETRMAEIIGLDPKTIRRGRRELEANLEGRPVDGVRAPGAGRHAVEQQDPSIEDDLVGLVEPETAGNPMVVVLYKRSSLRNLRDRLKEKGHAVSHPTVGRLLRKLDYSTKVNAKEEEESAAPPADRDAQFGHVEEQKRAHMDAGEPVISVDSKKKN